MTKHYPLGPPKSRETFPNRLNPTLVEGKILLTPDPEVWGKSMADRSLTDFLLDRIADYDQALIHAEQQISDLQAEYPFLPEDYGFEVIANPGEFMKTVYKKGSRMITRVDDDQWFIDGAGIVTMENARVAQTVLLALGVIQEKDFCEQVEYVINQPELTEKEKSNLLHQLAVDLAEVDELLENPDIEPAVKEGIEKRKETLQTEYKKLIA